ncbi:uncharacterized protein METZ01_LOCUS336351 [marine metagenome]|uniref:Uncharacterized protein n=1 Tax=marine metagenome TaxID=408172 RepID=A0A382QEP0_9ZZZZ
MIKENILGQRTRKRKRIKNNSTSLFQEYNFEILVLGLFGLGFFLLWEKWNIKSITWRAVTSSTLSIATFLRNISVWVGDIISGVETSDIIGIVLILIAFILVLNRARNRIIDHHPNLSSCPKCDTDLRRTHRKLKHKIQGWFLICRIKRFKCRSCPFDGIAMVKGKK